MDRITCINNYEAKIIAILSQFENKKKGTYLIVDNVNRHYQILRADWDTQNHYYFRVRIHLHIHDNGKIWVMENQVEEDIAELLVESGVPKSDIVLTLLPESVRKYTGYATA